VTKEGTQEKEEILGFVPCEPELAKEREPGKVVRKVAFRYGSLWLGLPAIWGFILAKG